MELFSIRIQRTFQLVSTGSYLFLTKSYAKQGKAMKQNSLCRIYPVSEPVAV